jgi:putative FmdB family regulatory protein
MPLNTYICKSCIKEFEVIARRPKSVATCPHCKGVGEKQFPLTANRNYSWNKECKE